MSDKDFSLNGLISKVSWILDVNVDEVLAAKNYKVEEAEFDFVAGLWHECKMVLNFNSLLSNEPCSDTNVIADSFVRQKMKGYLKYKDIMCGNEHIPLAKKYESLICVYTSNIGMLQKAACGDPSAIVPLSEKNPEYWEALMNAKACDIPDIVKKYNSSQVGRIEGTATQNDKILDYKDDCAAEASVFCGNRECKRKWKIINRSEVTIENGTYKIELPDKARTITGICDEDATPRDVYNIHFSKSEKDGIEYNDVTLYFIESSIIDGLVQLKCKYAKLDVGNYSQSQEGYELSLIRYRKTTNENYTFPDRPKILAINGASKLPETLFYDIQERDGVTIKRGKFRSHSGDQLKAIEKYFKECKIDFFEL